MRFVTCADFLERRQLSLPTDGNFVAVGIAASSEVDLVTINGHMLGPQALVPFGETCEAVRGRRNEPVAQLAGTLGQKLVLQLYECGDVIVPPGPRSMVVVSSGNKVLSDLLAAQVPLLRVPFSGRKQCTFYVQFIGGVGSYNCRVRGVRYQTAAYQAIEPIKFDTHAYVDDDADVLMVTAASGTDGDIQATIFHIGGGGDNQEAFDELELYVYGIGDLGETAHAMAEASGEQG